MQLLRIQSSHAPGAAETEVYIQLRFIPLFDVIKENGSSVLDGNIISAAQYSR